MRRGFTLIQISILLTVASLVLVAVLPSNRSQLNAGTLSAAKMNVVFNALRNYESVNAALPCPADASQLTTSTTFGVAAANSGTTSNCGGGTPAANYTDSTNNIAIGMVPVRALGLSNDYALDGFGRDITYAVDTNATTCFQGTLAGKILVTDNGAPNYTVAALISHGKDGHGAWIPAQGGTAAVRLNAGSTDTDENLVNAHGIYSGGIVYFPSNYASINTTVTSAEGTATTFVKKQPTTSPTVFDDLVIYKSTLWNINSAPIASSTALPTITSQPANGTYAYGQTLSFTLTFPNAVTVTGTPRLTLSALGTGSIGTSNTAYAIYSPGSSTSTALVFNYAIGSSDSAPTGLAMTSSVNLNGGTITNSSGASVCLIFTAPNLSGVLIISGSLYVTDQNNGRVQKFSIGGTYVSQFGSTGTGSGQFKSGSGPGGVAIDSGGNIWVADVAGNRLEKFNSSGVFQSQIGCSGSSACSSSSANGSFSSPAAIAFDSSGNLWVVDSNNNRIEEFNSGGTYVGQFGCGGSGACANSSAAGKFAYPQAIAFDPSGNMYIADYSNNRVAKYTVSSSTWSQIGCASGACAGSVANGKFDGEIWGLSTDASGNLYVADFTANRVQKFNASGTYVGQIGGCTSGACSASSANGSFNGADTVMVDSSGNVWVTDDNNQRVQEFNSSGVFVLGIGAGYNGVSGSVGTAGTGNGQFNGPNFMAIR